MASNHSSIKYGLVNEWLLWRGPLGEASYMERLHRENGGANEPKRRAPIQETDHQDPGFLSRAPLTLGFSISTWLCTI
jgi:hypothetical protein